MLFDGFHHNNIKMALFLCILFFKLFSLKKKMKQHLKITYTFNSLVQTICKYFFFLFQNFLISLSDVTIELLSKNMIMKQQKLMTKKILSKNMITKQENFSIKIWNVLGGLLLGPTRLLNFLIISHLHCYLDSTLIWHLGVCTYKITGFYGVTFHNSDIASFNHCVAVAQCAAAAYRS